MTQRIEPVGGVELTYSPTFTLCNPVELPIVLHPRSAAPVRLAPSPEVRRPGPR